MLFLSQRLTFTVDIRKMNRHPTEQKCDIRLVEQKVSFQKNSHRDNADIEKVITSETGT